MLRSCPSDDIHFDVKSLPTNPLKSPLCPQRGTELSLSIFNADSEFGYRIVLGFIITILNSHNVGNDNT